MTATARRKPDYHRGQKDTLVYQGVTGEDLRVSMAVAPLDRLAGDMDAFWGTDRLPSLVSPITAERYARAMEHLNACIERNDATEAAAAAANCMRGLVAMDAEAKAAGHTQHNPACWEYTHEGRLIGIVRDVADAAIAADARPGLTIYTLREVALALAAYGQAVLAVKENFPGATVTAIRKPTELEESLDDCIPF